MQRIDVSGFLLNLRQALFMQDELVCAIFCRQNNSHISLKQTTTVTFRLSSQLNSDQFVQTQLIGAT